MDEKDKQELIELCLKLPCYECGQSNQEFTHQDMTETKDNKSFIIPNVPIIRCKSCDAVSYPSFAYDYIDNYKCKHSKKG